MFYFNIKLFLLLIFLSFNSLALTPNFGSESGVNWQHWDKSAFDKAKEENKLILINVGMEGCTACNRMEKITYQNPAVIEYLNKHFIAIAVDAQARPDIGERYSDWAWPATAFLMPDATQVFAMAGNRLPQNFIPILQGLQAKHEDGNLEPDPNSPYGAQPKPVASDLSRLRDKVRQQVDRSFNFDTGGWSSWGVNAEVDGAKLLHLYYRAHLDNDAKLQQAALKVSQTYLKTLDPVWGGAYEATVDESANDVPEEFAKLRLVPEKRINSQANALLAFAEAYLLTREEKYRHGAAEVDRFLENWMLSPSGTWYTNQKDTPPHLPADWWPEDYWLLDTDAKRRKYGVPPVDHAIYSDKNTDLALAYLRAYEAFGDQAYLNKAIRASESLMVQRLQKAGWLRQSIATDLMASDQRVHPHSQILKPFLSTQAKFGRLLLKLHQLSGEQKWLAIAVTLGDAMLANLHDKDHGGFWAAPLDETAKLILPRKPLEDNAIAASFFYDLYILSKQARFASIAEQTIRSVAGDKILAREGKLTGETALLLEKLTAKYVEFSIVTHKPESLNAQQLYAAGLAVNHPHKLIHFEAPGRYPDMGQAVVFICSPDKCSLPLKRVEQVAKTAANY